MSMKNTEFGFKPGKRLSSKYEVMRKLGSGWEGEVYLVKELDTDIERAAKFFYEKRNPKNKTIKNYARKLHKLRACHSLIKYIAKEKLQHRGEEVTYLLSDFIEGETLDSYMERTSPKGVHFFQALHLFYAIVKAVEEIHKSREWHGDIHSENIIVQKAGLYYELKLIDIFQTGHGQKGSIQDDVFQLCHLLYEMIGGREFYRHQPQMIKSICSGLKKSLIRKKFKNATQLRDYLESSPWE